MTDKYAVIGNPIDFSKSPFIHMSFASGTQQDIAYTKILGPLGGFKETVDQFRKAGGRGINITAPFKLDAFQYASKRSPGAELAGRQTHYRLQAMKTLPRILTASGWFVMLFIT